MTFRHFFFSLLFALPILLQNCAQVAQPPGGKKDTLAPKLVSSIPKMRQLNYEGKIVELEFDEYVNTENLQQKVTVTPQDSNTFIAKSLPQGVRLTFSRPFQKNTTYTINFADGIKDITERNIAKDTKIVFSTGGTIDSLNLSGNVVDDETRRPLLNFLVGLFASTDTLPITRKRPQYFARTDSNGNYRIENIKAGLYKVYGFDDKDLNLVNNTPNERVAFRDSVLNLNRNYTDVNMVAFRGSTKPRVTRRERTDETLGLELNSGIASYRLTYPGKSAASSTDSTKSTTAAVDSAAVDSAAGSTAATVKNSGDTLISFLESPKMIRIFRPATRAANDTINIVIVAVDSVGNRTDLKERVYFSPLKTREKDRKPLNVQVLPQTREPIDNNLDFTLTFTKPVLRFDPERIIIGPDSTKPLQLTAEDLKWTNNFSQLSIRRSTNLKDTLLFKLGKGAFISVQGDTLAAYVAKYTIAEEDTYSQIAGKINPSAAIPPGANIIVELLDEKYIVLRTSRGASSYDFSRLKPGKYRVRLIVDANKNGKRDIGNVQKGIQPEVIIYQPGSEEDGTIRLRQNFELTDIDF
ncbi:Ig-like domain-containing domain [Spirosoma sp. KUDC1026]|uniref:Ig-like domain-containing domain n=1 Tax=Spirosoma sp. KUDC1026 TaxID=2745947 RepID=UPI00159BB8A2|nr:Ig-like domain-containing domain [Spirosoma sp. KUDC1026]QKZ15133.1 Ig-like domain-containing protein [Spirosoma sp. KUDC1026]